MEKIEVLEKERDEALEFVDGKHGIEEFMLWFIHRYQWFNKDQLKMSLDAWCESKSRSRLEKGY